MKNGVDKRSRRLERQVELWAKPKSTTLKEKEIRINLTNLERELQKTTTTATQTSPYSRARIRTGLRAFDTLPEVVVYDANKRELRILVYWTRTIVPSNV